MAALVLGTIALATVVLSFAFSALVVVMSRESEPRERATTPQSRIDDERRDDDSGNVTETMSRVLAEVERLAALQERGALTDKEFAAQKARLLLAGKTGDRPALPQRAR